MGHSDLTFQGQLRLSRHCRVIGGLVELFRVPCGAMGLRKFANALFFCLFICTFLSILRLPYVGSLQVDGALINFQDDPYLHSFAGLALVFAAYFHWRSLRLAPMESWNYLVKFAIALHAVAFLSMPLTSNDVFSNLAYGRMASLGIDPFSFAPVDLPMGDLYRSHVTEWNGTSCVYGPLLVLLAQWSISPVMMLAVTRFKCATLAMVALALWMAYRFCRKLPEPEGKERFVMLAWHPLFAWELTGQAHNDSILVLGIMLWLFAAARQRWTVATLGLAAATMTKIVTLPMLGLYLFFLMRRSPRQSLTQAIVFTSLLVLGYLPYWNGPATLYPALSAVGQADRAAHSLSLGFLMLGQVLTPNNPALFLGPFLVLIKLGLVVLAIRLADRIGTWETVLDGSLVFTLLLLSLGTPWLMPWYATWLLPLTMVCQNRCLRMAALVYSLAILETYLPACLGTGWFVFPLSLGPLVYLARRGELQRLWSRDEHGPAGNR